MDIDNLGLDYLLSTYGDDPEVVRIVEQIRETSLSPIKRVELKWCRDNLIRIEINPDGTFRLDAPDGSTGTGETMGLAVNNLHRRQVR
jgi:hypothetical protein